MANWHQEYALGNSTSSSVSSEWHRTLIRCRSGQRKLTPSALNPCSDDMYAPESIDLLVKSGINFKRHEEYGISVESFGELLISSGLVLLDEVQWVSFHRRVLRLTLRQRSQRPPPLWLTSRHFQRVRFRIPAQNCDLRRAASNRSRVL